MFKKSYRIDFFIFMVKITFQLSQAEKSVESKQTEDDSSETLEMLNFTNERILSYGEEVLKESTGVRPLFPIIKAIEVSIKLKIDNKNQNNKFKILEN